MPISDKDPPNAQSSAWEPGPLGSGQSQRRTPVNYGTKDPKIIQQMRRQMRRQAAGEAFSLHAQKPAAKVRSRKSRGFESFTSAGGDITSGVERARRSLHEKLENIALPTEKLRWWTSQYGGGLLTLDVFAEALEQFGKQLEDWGTAVYIAYSSDIYTTLLEKTPFTTGMTRNNWQVGIDGIPSGMIPNQDQARWFLLKIRKAYISQNIFIVNNVPWMQKLEGGMSKYAPFGIVQPTLAEVNARWTPADIERFLAGMGEPTQRNGISPAAGTLSSSSYLFKRAREPGVDYGDDLLDAMERDMEAQRAHRAGFRGHFTDAFRTPGQLGGSPYGNLGGTGGARIRPRDAQPDFPSTRKAGRKRNPQRAQARDKFPLAPLAPWEAPARIPLNRLPSGWNPAGESTPSRPSFSPISRQPQTPDVPLARRFTRPIIPSRPDTP